MVKTNSRNLSLECCKLLAACFVVFLHIPFPGVFGQVVLCLSRFAVPLFFAVSGWFSFGASAGKLRKRLGHILLLELVGAGLYVVWRTVLGWSWGGDPYWCLVDQLPNREALKLWLFWNVDPFAGHLWYLSATALCYGVLWIYRKITGEKKDYRPLYSAAVILLLGCFAMGEFSRFTGIQVDYRIGRSGLFTGIPLFFMGVFLREYREKLAAWGLPLLALGLLLSILEGKHFGVYDLYIGSVLTAASVLLLTFRFPDVPGWLAKAATSFGCISTVVYLVHLLLVDIYALFILKHIEHLGDLVFWLKPVIVLALSLFCGVCWNVLRKWSHKMK